MGQKQSKRVSNASSNSLLLNPTRTISTVYNSPPNSPSSPTSPTDSNTGITPPAPPPRLIRLSEIIDPREVLQAEYEAKLEELPTIPRRASQPLSTPRTPSRGLVQSPSGNVLGAEEFISHPDRPLALWERQERVVQATRKELERHEAETRAEVMSRISMRSVAKKKRGCCGWG